MAQTKTAKKNTPAKKPAKRNTEKDAKKALARVEKSVRAARAIADLDAMQAA